MGCVRKKMIPPSLYWLYGQPGVRIIFEPCGIQDFPPIFFYGKRQIIGVLYISELFDIINHSTFIHANDLASI